MEEEVKIKRKWLTDTFGNNVTNVLVIIWGYKFAIAAGVITYMKTKDVKKTLLYAGGTLLAQGLINTAMIKNRAKKDKEAGFITDVD